MYQGLRTPFPWVDDFRCLLFYVVSRFLSLSPLLLSTIQSIAFRDTIRNNGLIGSIIMAAGSGGNLGGRSLVWSSLVRGSLLRYGLAWDGMLILIPVFTRPVCGAIRSTNPELFF